MLKDIYIQVENLEQAVAEIERLRKEAEKLQGELTGTLHLHWDLHLICQFDMI